MSVSPVFDLSRELEKAREHARRGVAEGLGGSEITFRYSENILQILRNELKKRPAPDGAVLVVVGSLARGELCPYGDLDLFLLNVHGLDDAKSFEKWGREFVHPFWDAGVKLNLGVQSVDSWLEQAGEDLDLCTALLDAQSVSSDLLSVQAVTELRNQARGRYFGEARTAFLQRLRDEVEARHRRYGTTVYRVEPDLKFGSGGSRDLAVLRWACQSVSEGEREISSSSMFDPEGVDGFPDRAREAIMQAREVILRLRCALQLTAKRSQARLVFAFQDDLPSLWHPSLDDAERIAAVERMMQEYYRSARDVLCYGTRLFAHCLVPLVGVIQKRPIGDGFYLADGQLFFDEQRSLTTEPSKAMEALLLAGEHKARISGELYDRILDLMDLPATGKLVDDPLAQSLMMDILLPTRESRSPSVLENALDLGVLDRLIPEFLPSRGRMQREGLHVYTVDQHSLFAVEFLKALLRGEYRKDFPLATGLQLMLNDLRVLYLATLLHDSGKALGDQCEIGSQIAERVALRLGFSGEEARRCGFLVQEHLRMPMLSQKRDLSDPLLIAEFADQVGDMTTLIELYLLSLADMANVSPGFLTNWKLTLLDELYLLTATHLRHGVQHPSAMVEADLGDPKEAHLEPRIEGEHEPQGLSERYRNLYDTELRNEHQRLIDSFRELAKNTKAKKELKKRHVVLELADAAGTMRLTVVCRDGSKVLARITAALDECGLNVLAADLFAVPGPDALVLDVFRVHPAQAGERSLMSWRGHLEDHLNDRLGRELEPYKPPRSSLSAMIRGGVQEKQMRNRLRDEQTMVRFEEDPAGERTIVEVRTPDQKGVLRRIAWVFAELEIDIELARLGSEGGMVEDAFYVERLEEGKRQSLKTKLLEVFPSS